jgi:hypothetical protein
LDSSFISFRKPAIPNPLAFTLGASGFGAFDQNPMPANRREFAFLKMEDFDEGIPAVHLSDGSATMESDDSDYRDELFSSSSSSDKDFDNADPSQSPPITSGDEGVSWRRKIAESTDKVFIIRFQPEGQSIPSWYVATVDLSRTPKRRRKAGFYTFTCMPPIWKMRRQTDYGTVVTGQKSERCLEMVHS